MTTALFSIQAETAPGASLDPAKWETIEATGMQAAAQAYAEKRVKAMSPEERAALAASPLKVMLYVAAPKVPRHANGAPQWVQGFSLTFG
jgi:hypothetical protein